MRPFFTRLSLIFILATFFTANAFAEPAQGLFGSTEYKSTELGAFKKWASIRVRHQNDQKPIMNDIKNTYNRCRRTKNFKCVNEEWQGVINSLKNKSENVKIDSVNRYLNNSPYITDIINWQQKDYWATIKQFLGKNGDCEDYAIAKYYSLKKLGFSAQQMRIVIVHDNNLNVAHAVLAVYIQDKIWILDNQISNIITEDKVIHYRPLYSINENAWWLHKIS